MREGVDLKEVIMVGTDTKSPPKDVKVEVWGDPNIYNRIKEMGSIQNITGHWVTVPLKCVKGSFSPFLSPLKFK